MASQNPPIVKICGLQTVEAAQAAIDAGADLLGVIMVPNRKRTVALDVAQQISRIAREARQKAGKSASSEKNYSSFDHNIQHLRNNGPFLVGVFRNQPLAEVQRMAREVPLDFVQLHGSEPRQEFIRNLEVPVIARFVAPEALGDFQQLDGETQRDLAEMTQFGSHFIGLFDGEAGGEGRTLNWEEIGLWNKSVNKSTGRFLLAGGLTPENVAEAVQIDGVCGVDVSGGVETDGEKDIEKIKLFVCRAKKVE